MIKNIRSHKNRYTMNRRTLLLVGLLLFSILNGFSQSKLSNSIIVDIETVDDSVRSAAIFNNGDSVLCLLLSPYFSLKNDSVPVFLVPYNEKEGKTVYNLLYSKEDSRIDAAIGNYLGVCVLPYQA